MRAGLVAVVLLVALSARAEEPAQQKPLALTVEVHPEEPRPGERVFWIARLTNTSGFRLFLPAEAREALSVSANFFRPDEHYGVGWGFGEGSPRLPEEWLELAPGAAIEKAGELGDLVRECRGGCIEGSAALNANIIFSPLPEGATLPDDHVVPAPMHADTGVRIERAKVAVVERGGVGDVAAKVLSARAARGGLQLRVRLENRSGAPLWMPKPPLLSGRCRVEWLGEDGTRGGSGMRGGWEPRDSADERALVLVQPGRALETDVACDGALPKRGSLHLLLEQGAVVEPRRALVPPFVWTGQVEAAPYVIGKR